MHSPNDLLALAHQFVELDVRPDIQLPEALEECLQVADRGISENLRLAPIVPGKPFRQVRDQLRQFFHEGGFGQPHRLVKPGLDPFAFFTVELGLELPQVFGWLNARELPADIEQVQQGIGVIAGVEQSPQPLAGSGFQGFEMVVEFPHSLLEFAVELLQVGIEGFDAILADQPDSWLRIRQRNGPPVGNGPAPDSRDCLELRVSGINKFLTSGEEFPFGSECVRGLGLLGTSESLAGAEPSETEPDGRHGSPQLVGRRNGCCP